MSWRQTARGLSRSQLARAVFRKFIFRRTELGLYEVQSDRARHFDSDDWEFEILCPDDVDVAVVRNPFLSQEDLAEFRRHPAAVCLVARHRGEVAGSVWALQVSANIHELGREIFLAADTHYLCRAYVAEAFQGRSLHAVMLSEYCRRQKPGSRICGLMYDWNVAPIRNAKKVGWARTGTYWSVWVLGLHFTGFRPAPKVAQ